MSPRENKCRTRRSRGWHWFSTGDNFLCFSLVQSMFIKLYRMLITSSTLRFILKQSRSSDYLSLYSYNSNALTMPARIYGESYAHKSCAVDIFLEYHPSPCHHMLGRGFMIHRVILIFIKCLSANQNQQFYMKV